MSIKFVEFASVSHSQRFATREEASSYALKTMNDLSKEGLDITSMSIHDDFSYSNRRGDTDAKPTCIGFMATISASSGRRYTDGMFDENETVAVVA